MRFNLYKCPECGCEAYGIDESVPCLALIAFDRSGNAEYIGENKMHWDGQAPNEDGVGNITLRCHNGHGWQATMTD
jgi:hypothetical protein